MRDREHIAICIPSVDGKIPTVLASWLTQLTSSNAEKYAPFRFSIIFVGYKQPYEYARNICVREFLKTDADRLWFIDADMIPRPETINLLTVDADIAVGAYARVSGAKDGTVELNLLLFGERDEPDEQGHILHTLDFTPSTKPVDIAAGGTGCMIIKRHVLEDRRMWASDEWTNQYGVTQQHSKDTPAEDAAPPIFRVIRRPDGGMERGEDVQFCSDARRLGYTLKGHMLYGMGHIKECDADAIARSFSKHYIAGKEAACLTT